MKLNIAISLIRFYQSLTPLLHQIQLTVFGTMYRCPQSPSCSEYAIRAVQKHGTIAGLRKGIRRIWLCR